jgi:hypothetical protein
VRFLTLLVPLRQADTPVNVTAVTIRNARFSFDITVGARGERLAATSDHVIISPLP